MVFMINFLTLLDIKYILRQSIIEGNIVHFFVVNPRDSYNFPSHFTLVENVLIYIQ